MQDIECCCRLDDGVVQVVGEESVKGKFGELDDFVGAIVGVVEVKDVL